MMAEATPTLCYALRFAARIAPTRNTCALDSMLEFGVIGKPQGSEHPTRHHAIRFEALNRRTVPQSHRPRKPRCGCSYKVGSRTWSA